MNVPILSLFLLVSLNNEAVVGASFKHVKLSKVREIVALLQSISRQTRLEGEQENALYEDVKRFCAVQERSLVTQDDPQPEKSSSDLVSPSSNPQVICSLPIILVGVSSWNGANCASGAKNVLQGTTCEILAESGFSCMSPGMCGADGSFANTASCRATCASVSCPSGFTRVLERASSTIVTNANCCQATCASHSCPSGSLQVSSRSSSTTVTNANCCQATCASHSCPAGFVQITSRSSSTTVTNANCCQATCATYSCPSGYVQVSSRASSTTVTNANCCRATCASHSCPASFVQVTSRSSSTTVTNANCCQATCASHSCPRGFARMSSRALSSIVTNVNCCQATCASHSCAKGYILISSRSSSTTVSDSHCCQATCASHACPNGSIPISSRFSSTKVSDAYCCKARVSVRQKFMNSSKMSVLARNTQIGHRFRDQAAGTTSTAVKNASMTHKRETPAAFISKGFDSDEADDEDADEALQKMGDLLKDNSSEGVAIKDDESVVHESEALESAIESTENNLKSEATQEEAIVKEQLKEDLKDYAKIDNSADKVATGADISSGNEDDDTTEALTLPESGDSLPSPISSDRIVHTRTARILLGTSQPQNAYAETERVVDSMDKDAHVAAKMKLSASRTNTQNEGKKHGGKSPPQLQADAFHKLASRLPSLDDLARAIPNVDKDALAMYNTVDDSDLGNDDSLDVPPSFVQVVQDQAIAIPQADLDAVWNSLSSLAGQTQAGMNMIDLLRHVAPEETQLRTHASLRRHFRNHVLAAFQEQGAEQQCQGLLQNFEQRQEYRRKVYVILKRAMTILAHALLPARRLRGFHRGARERDAR